MHLKSKVFIEKYRFFIPYILPFSAVYLAAIRHCSTSEAFKSYLLSTDADFLLNFCF